MKKVRDGINLTDLNRTLNIKMNQNIQTHKHTDAERERERERGRERERERENERESTFSHWDTESSDMHIIYIKKHISYIYIKKPAHRG
jgi:hypothetical protein